MTAGLNGHLTQMNGHGRAPDRSHLRAFVLLAGSVRANDLTLATTRSRLDLPVDETRTVLSLWQAQAEALAAAAHLARLPLRVVIDTAAPEPTVPPPAQHVSLTVERDAKDFRGTGGLLRDLAVAYAPSDLLLVANAAQILIDPLPELAESLFRVGGSVSFIGHRDGTPCGLFLVRCDALATIRDIGFLDFKEQVLPKLGAAGHQVRPVMRDAATAMPIRTLEGYLHGVKALARLRKNLPRDTDPFGEEWAPTFSIVEPGAVVDPGATIHDSVVLRGATVRNGAVVVRSVVGPGATVEPGDIVADEAVGLPRVSVEPAPGRRATA